jgi:hypothetical protein
MTTKTKQQLLDEIAANFPDNNLYLITPAKLREVNVDMVDSMYGGSGGASATALSVSATGSVSGDPSRKYVSPIGVECAGTYLVPTGKWVQNLSISNYVGCSSVTFSDLAGIVDNLTMTGSPANFSAPALYATLGDFVCTTMASLDISGLKATMGMLNITSSESLTALDLSNLIYTGISGTSESLTINLESVPSLDLANYIGGGGGISITLFTATSLLLPNLKFSGPSLYISYCTMITSLSLPSLERITGGGGLTVQFCSSLTDFSIGSNLKEIGGDVQMDNNALSQTSVDDILLKLVSLDGTNGTVLFQALDVILTGGTNSAPSATGLAAKAALEARGCTVSVNT